jgi:hypothetical protein
MIVTVAAGALLCAVAFAQTAEIPGWSFSRGSGYDVALDSDVRHGGARSAVIGCAVGRCPGFAMLTQTIRAEPFRGQRLRLSGLVKAANVRRANLWMRVDGAGAVLAFDDMEKRRARGTFDWRRQQIVLDVPDFAYAINYGLILDGDGEAWVDDLALEPVEKTVKVTNTLRVASAVRSGMSPAHSGTLLATPANMDFEQVAPPAVQLPPVAEGPASDTVVQEPNSPVSFRLPASWSVANVNHWGDHQTTIRFRQTTEGLGYSL